MGLFHEKREPLTLLPSFGMLARVPIIVTFWGEKPYALFRRLCWRPSITLLGGSVVGAGRDRGVAMRALRRSGGRQTAGYSAVSVGCSRAVGTVPEPCDIAAAALAVAEALGFTSSFGRFGGGSPSSVILS